MKPSKLAVSSMAALSLLLLLLLASDTEAAVSCSTVLSNLRPCMSYLTSGSGKPPAACCSGVKALSSAAATAADKKTACECIKKTTQSVKLNADLAKALPGNCGISLAVPVTPGTDCSTIG